MRVMKLGFNLRSECLGGRGLLTMVALRQSYWTRYKSFDFIKSIVLTLNSSGLVMAAARRMASTMATRLVLQVIILIVRGAKFAIFGGVIALMTTSSVLALRTKPAVGILGRAGAGCGPGNAGRQGGWRLVHLRAPFVSRLEGFDFVFIPLGRRMRGGRGGFALGRRGSENLFNACEDIGRR